MRTYTSAWEMAVARVAQLRVDTSVLDQLLRGCAEVRWEIQALQDQDITVETLDPTATTSAGADLAALRRLLCEEAEIVIRPVGHSPGPRAALWSVAGSLDDRRRLAELMDGDLYEPEILIHSAGGGLTGQRALGLAAKIGAISPQRAIRLADGQARLEGLYQVQPS